MLFLPASGFSLEDTNLVRIQELKTSQLSDFGWVLRFHGSLADRHRRGPSIPMMDFMIPKAKLYSNPGLTQRWRHWRQSSVSDCLLSSKRALSTDSEEEGKVKFLGKIDTAISFACLKFFDVI